MIPDIAAALAARLGAWADAEGISVAWENVPFTPPVNEMYLAVHDMPATPRTVDLGLRCRIYSGVYQINVVAPVGIGRTDVVALTDRVAELFPEGQEIEGRGFTCWIDQTPGVFRGITTSVSYTVPVSLNYRADISS
ncbi:phage tail terminator-like protein [Enterobacter bugandensis]|uniref:phage tail terminator-like protein n=1 Tax=Enterobacter bugandensis TaxID=881260 RepID=UPI00375525B4